MIFRIGDKSLDFWVLSLILLMIGFELFFGLYVLGFLVVMWGFFRAFTCFLVF